MAETVDDIINRAYQGAFLGPDAVAEQQAPVSTGLMSSRVGTTTESDTNEEERPASALDQISDFMKRLAVESGYNAKGAAQPGVRITPSSPTMSTRQMYDRYQTPIYDFLRNNESGVASDLSMWVRQNPDLSGDYLDSLLQGMKDTYDYRDERKVTRMVDAPEGQGELSSPEPLYEMAREIDPGTIETSSMGLMARPADSSESNFEDMLMDRLIEEEKFKGEAYRATKGEKHLTIGYGHYGPDVKKGQTITEEEALNLLRKDINDRMPAIRKAIPEFDNLSNNLKVEIAQSWFRGGMSGSPNTIKLINEGKFEEAAEEFLDNEEYRTARERGRAGIIPRMEAVADALRNET